MFNERKTVKKGRRIGRIKRDTPRITRTNFTLTEMFERFLIFKSSEGLSLRTLEDCETHFNYQDILVHQPCTHSNSKRHYM